MLVQHLPRDSALARELHGEAADWSVTDYLLAHAVDQLQEANWILATVNRDEDSDTLDYPEPVVRPGDPAGEHAVRERPAASPSSAEIARFFG